MKKLFFLICVIILLFSCTERKNKNAISKFPKNPEQSEIISSDVDLFWNAFDELMKDSLCNPFEDYIKNGSPGIHNFINDQRIVSAKALKELVLSEKEYYSKVRASTYEAIKFEKQIRASFYALEYLYPEAVFPPTYFLIGRTTSGGTASEVGLSIGLEIFSNNKAITNYGRPSLELELVPFLVTHEIIHFLQTDDDSDNSLLKHCIREGAADFIAELAAGEKVKYCNGSNVYSYGKAHKEELFKEFIENKDNTDLSPWLYSGTKDGRPQNLGYWIGYEIVKTYYNNHINKKEAIKEILNIEDYNHFYKKSNIQKEIYGGKVL